MCLLVGIPSYGQAPDWSVDQNNFEYTMTLVAFVTIDGTNLSNINDMVGAFSNGELRGATNLIYAPNKDRYYAYLTVFSNTNGETLDFKVYNAGSNEIVDITKTIDFEINAHYGSLSQAYSFASPALTDVAAIVNFEFENVVISNQTINGTNLTLTVEEGQDLTALNTIFELSNGAQLFRDGVALTSGSTTLDLSGPVTFQVLSEDESTLEDWVVTVNTIKDTTVVVSDVKYFKKDAVCYAGGVIKVTTPTNNIEAELTKDGTNIGSEMILNVEALFTELGIGLYVLKVGSTEKEITINLKQ